MLDLELGPHEPPVVSCNLDPDDNSELSGSSSSKKAAALFILTFQERYKLSQKATNSAIGTVNTIVDSACEEVGNSLKERLPGADICDCLNQRESPFSGLDTEYKQSKYYRESLDWW